MLRALEDQRALSRAPRPPPSCAPPKLGAAFVRGLQGDHPRYLKVAACAKHFAVHSGPEAQRHSFDARVSLRDLWTTYLPAFRHLVVEARVEIVMGAYNRTLGEPCCASRLLLVDILRGRWGFAGHVVSDCWALTDLHKHHRVTADPVESAALALRRGCDLACGCTFDLLGEALGRGLITEAELDQALGRHLRTRFRLGLFDPEPEVPHASVPLSVVECAEHRALAREAAALSVVLLRNRDATLPLRPELESILVVGPCAADNDVLLGNYFGLPSSMTSLLEGIVGRLPEGVRFDYRMGCQAQAPNGNEVDWSVSEARKASLVIACLGLNPQMEGEEGDAIASDNGGDRRDVLLPEVQLDYLRRVIETGTPVVAILTGGAALSLGGLECELAALLWVGYPGQEGGRAVAEILFGGRSPSGKLPVTFYRSVAELPPYDDYAMAGRTYRYFEGEPLFPFGFGLAYGRCRVEALDAPATLRPGDWLEIAATVAHSGGAAYDEVVQCYLAHRDPSCPAPRWSLVGFERVPLAPGETRGVVFRVPPDAMALRDEQGAPFFEAGRLRVVVGTCSPGARGVALGAPPALEREIGLLA